jgi:hypothetical protein
MRPCCCGEDLAYATDMLDAMLRQVREKFRLSAEASRLVGRGHGRKIRRAIRSTPSGHPAGRSTASCLCPPSTGGFFGLRSPAADRHDAPSPRSFRSCGACRSRFEDRSSMSAKCKPVFGKAHAATQGSGSSVERDLVRKPSLTFPNYARSDSPPDLRQFHTIGAHPRKGSTNQFRCLGRIHSFQVGERVLEATASGNCVQPIDFGTRWKCAEVS